MTVSDQSFPTFESGDFFFDQFDELETWVNDLPHWEQEDKLQFVTFRLADALPQECLIEIKNRKDSFIKQNPKPWNKKTLSQYINITSDYEERMLANGYGSCILKNYVIRQIVIETLEYFNYVRYILFGYVIMPNHIHMLILPAHEYKLRDILQSIKRHSSRKINKLLNSSGKIWQSEGWDRVVRNEEHYKHCISYIRKNPEHLNKTDFSFGGFLFEKLL